MTEITHEADAWPESMEDTFFVRGAMMRQLLDDHAVMKEALELTKEYFRDSRGFTHGSRVVVEKINDDL